MTKQEYMKRLACQLRHLPKEDFQRAMDYFEEYFADAGAENEQRAIDDLGTPEDAARDLILNLNGQPGCPPKAAKAAKTAKKKHSAIWIFLLVLLAIPIGIPLGLGILLAIGGVIVAILFTIFSVLFSAAAIAVCGIAGLIGGIALMFQSLADGLATMGTALFVLGAGMILSCGAFLFCRWLIHKISRIPGRIAKRRHRSYEEIN